MEERLAKIVSELVHPLLIPTYAMLILVNTRTHFTLVLPQNFRYLTVLFVFLTSFALPALIMIILLKLGRIRSLQMESRQERVLRPLRHHRPRWYPGDPADHRSPG